METKVHSGCQESVSGRRSQYDRLVSHRCPRAATTVVSNGIVRKSVCTQHAKTYSQALGWSHEEATR